MVQKSVQVQDWSTKLGSAQVCGRFIPGMSWSDSGTGLLWIEDAYNTSEAVSQFVKWLQVECSVAPRHSGQNGEHLVLGGREFLTAVTHLAQSAQKWTLAPELDLYVRIWRLALEFVRRGEIAAYAAPAGIRQSDVYASLFRAGKADEDGWVEWSSHTERYKAAWMPVLTSDKRTALRLVYVSLADRLWEDGWEEEYGWSEEEHGRNLTDLWLWRCVDALTRRMLKDKPTDDVFEQHSVYRVSYRGEDEVVQRWQRALWAGPDDAYFSADGWLVWRIVKQTFHDAGWKELSVFERSGKAFYHLEFELVPPVRENPAADWKLVYYIAHNHFPYRALLSAWWQTPGRTWRVGKERLVSPDVWVLPALRAAGEIYEPIADSLKQAGPSQCVIAPEEVYDFVTDGLVRLRAHGIVVKTPEIDESPAADIRIRVQVKRMKTKSSLVGTGRRTESWFDTQQLVDFDWTLVIDDHEISGQEFENMVNQRVPYLQLGGSWRLVPLQDILNQVQELAGTDGNANSATLNLMQFSRSVFMAEEDENTPFRLEVEYDREAAELGEMMKALKGASEPKAVEPPKGFQGTLRKYQAVGYSWLLHLRQMELGGCLADDMGLGKTIQVLAYLLHLKEQHLNQGAHLLVCPTSLLQNWKAEIARFTPDLSIHIHHGASRNQEVSEGKSLLHHAFENCDLVITTYATVMRDLDYFLEQKYDVLIVDEAQNIKNAHTKQAQAVRKLQAHHKVALTGTPVENRLEELWSIFQFCTPGYLGSLSWFRKVFADPISANPKSAAALKLHRLLQPVLLRRQKSDPTIQMELPEKWEIREHSSLTAEQAALYQSVVNRLFVNLGQGEQSFSRRGQILAALVRLKQICDHPCLVTGGNNAVSRSGKLKLVLDLLEGVVAEEESALIFTQFRDMGELLCDAIEEQFGWRPKFLHGGLSASARGQMVADFQSKKDTAPVLVLSLKAGGVGLNLTRANHVFHFDRWWNPAVEDQATDRAFRIGQTKDVQVHKLVCSGTLEERIDALIHSKRLLSASVVGESEGWITEMDNEELRSLFALDEESAIGEEE
ncbi:DEAD/DEAH box helicase [Alicyclobacillus tolerans]|uniref:DEAD/DEAH box helicase n=1 Tax=Alicyclobacillus tolerans TaxID=90970 RepID=UPI001F2BC6EB|nr:DEAD/DEAH box helicase [Alicyclobacillus tolerans]MCF8565262.1 DEAD/DEAH box helicase [Alicyclobacillus tolerans]